MFSENFPKMAGFSLFFHQENFIIASKTISLNQFKEKDKSY